MLTLLVGLLRTDELPELAVAGALYAANQCMQGRPAVSRVALELGLVELVSSQLSRAGAAADWLSTVQTADQSGSAGRVTAIASGGNLAVSMIVGGFSDSEARPDLDALLSSASLHLDASFSHL